MMLAASLMACSALAAGEQPARQAWQTRRHDQR
jgi:hypothetical protein